MKEVKKIEKDGTQDTLGYNHFMLNDRHRPFVYHHFPSIINLNIWMKKMIDMIYMGFCLSFECKSEHFLKVRLDLLTIVAIIEGRIFLFRNLILIHKY